MPKKFSSKPVSEGRQQKLNQERRYLEIVVRAYVVFILAFYPLYVTGEGYDNIVYRKAQVYWTVAIFFLVAFSIFFVVYYFSVNNDRTQKRFLKSLSLVDWTLLAFLLAVTLSFIFSEFKSEAWLGAGNRYDGYLTILLMTLSYFPISRYYKPNRLDFTLFAASSSILCMIGFLQFYGYDFLKLFPYNRPPYSDEAGNSYYSGFSISFRSTIGNIDFVSCYVCMAIVVFGVLFVKSKGWRQYLYLAASAMNFMLMIIGGADAGKVGTLGAMVLLVPYWVASKKSFGKALILSSAFGFVYCLHHWFMTTKIMPFWTEENRPIRDLNFKSAYHHLPLKPLIAVSLICFAAGACILLIKNIAWPKQKGARIAGLAMTVAIIIIGFTGVEIIGKNLGDRNIIHQAREIMHGNLEDHFGSNRGFIWKRAMGEVKNHPIFGTGPDTFMQAFGKDNQDTARELHGVLYDKAHNDFVQILLCEGILGLLTYLIFIAAILISSIKKSFLNIFSLTAMGGVLAYLFQSFFGIDTLIVTPIFWMMLAILRVPTTEESEKSPA